MTPLGTALQEAMHRVGVGAQTLSKLTGIPRSAIDNWREGVVRRPRHWRPLARIARALGLSESEVDRLLAAAGYPPAATLAAALPADHPDRELLRTWVAEQAPAGGRHQLRAPVADFVGRTGEIDRLVAALRQPADRQAVAGVRGMGGVGKTELAVLIGTRLTDTFRDGHLLLDLHGSGDSPLSPARVLRRAVHALAPDARLSDDAEQLELRYRAELHGRRILILADDARDAAQVRPLLPPLGCGLLVTTRRRFTLPGMTAVDLAPLDEEAAADLVAATSGRVTGAPARAVARAGGCLPLAVRICGTALHNNPALPVAAYLDHLADQRQRLSRLRDPDTDTDVAASLALSYRHLPESARAVFRQLGVLVSDFDTDLAAAVVVPPAAVPGTLQLLQRHSLVAYDPGARRWRLHDLLRDLAAGYLREAGGWEEAMWRYARAAVRRVESIAEGFLAGGADLSAALARFDADRPHIEAGRQWAAGLAGDREADHLLVAHNLATIQFGHLRYAGRKETIPQATAALAAARRLGDAFGEATALDRIGKTLMEVGEHAAALDHFRPARELLRRVGDTVHEARVLNDMGSACWFLGDLRRSIALNEEQLALALEIGDPRLAAPARCNLGLAHLGLGEADRAVQHLEAALALARELGARHGEGVVLENLGTAHLERGDARRAMDHLERALAITTELRDGYLEAAVRASLAHASVALDRPAEALGHAERAVTLSRDGGWRQFEGQAGHALGSARLAGGDRAGAAAAFEAALEILRAVGDQQAEARCGWEYGRALLAAGDRDRALPLLRMTVAYELGVGHVRAAAHAADLAALEAGVPV